MKSLFLKYLLVCVGCFLIHTTLSAQNGFEITKVKSSKLIEILNNLEFIARHKTTEYSINLYRLHNGPGSAGFPNGEVSHNLFVAVSEFDELPEQNLFEIGPFYNPVFKEWKESDKNGVFVVEYGPAKNRSSITLSVDINELLILSSKE